jgi:hypothetical protein
MFRRTRRDVGLAITRRVRLLAVRPTAAERRAHRLLDAYTGRVWREASGDGDADARLAMIVLRKRALSSMASLASSLEHRLSWLSGRRAGTSVQLPLPLTDPEDEGEKQMGDAEPDAALRAPGMADTATELELLTEVLDAARAAATSESKLAALARLLRRAGEPAIVFTEYRDTLSRIADEVGAHTPIAVLHGGLTRAERSAAERSFTTGPTRVLLATDVGGQGLNFIIDAGSINVELPWSPVRVGSGSGGSIASVSDIAFTPFTCWRRHREERVWRGSWPGSAGRGAVGAVSDPTGSMTERQVEAAMMALAPAGRLVDAKANQSPGRNAQAGGSRGRGHDDRVAGAAGRPVEFGRRTVCDGRPAS